MDDQTEVWASEALRLTPPVVRAFGLALVLMAVAAGVSGYDIVVSSHGVYYAELASDPFASNPNTHRMLAPLLAWVVGLRGASIVWFNLAMAALFLTVVAFRYQRQSPKLAIAVTAALAFTVVTTFTLRYSGYTDSLTHLLLLVAIVGVRRPYLYWVAFGLALLNREAALFLLPFLVLYARRAGMARPQIVVGTAAAVVSYVAFRAFLAGVAPSGHDAAFYLEPMLSDPLYWLRESALMYPLGAWGTFEVVWLIPAVAIVATIRNRAWWPLSLMLSALIGAAAQSVVAVDTTRLLAMAFPAIVVAVDYLIKLRGHGDVAWLIGSSALASLLIPTVYVTRSSVHLW